MIIGNYKVTTKIDWHGEILENVEIKNGVIKLKTKIYHLHPLIPKEENQWEILVDEFKNFGVSLGIGDFVLIKTYNDYDEKKKKHSYRVMKIKKWNKREFEKANSQSWQDVMRNVFEIIDGDWDE